MSRADATDGRGRKKGRGGEAEDVPQEETGWLDDLRGAKQAKDQFDDTDFTDGGSSRWDKLSALSDDAAPTGAPGAPADAGRRPRGGDAPAARRRDEDPSAGARRAPEDTQGGRRRTPDEPPAGRRRSGEEPSGRRRAGEDTGVAQRGEDTPTGRRRAEEEPSGRRRADDDTSGARRRPEDTSGGRRRVDEEPSGGHRRAAEEPTGRRAAEEPTGRRAVEEPTGRRAAEEPAGRRAAEEPAGRRAAEEPSGRRAAAEDTGSRRHGVDEPTGRRTGRPEAEEPRRGRPEPAPMEPPPGRTRPEPPLRKPGGEPPVVRRREMDPTRTGEISRITGTPAPDATRGRPAMPPAPAGMPGSPVARPPVRPEPQRAGFPAVTPVSPPPAQGRPNRGGVPIPPPGPAHGGPAPMGGMPPQSVPGPTAAPHAGPGPKQGGPVAGPGPMGGPGLVGGPVLGGAPMGPGMAGGPPAGPGPAGGRPPGRPEPIAVRPPDPNAVVPPAGDRRPGLAAGVDVIRGARSEVRKQLREQQRLRMWTLIALVAVVVGALPFYFVLRAATRDPVLTTLDALDVPTWAVTSGKTVDNIYGSRWCLIDCRYRERSLESARGIDDTTTAYQKALTDAGWARWDVPSCVLDEGGEGKYSCWRRDEFTLDLWVRPITTPECTDLLRNRPTIGPSAAPSTAPSADPPAAASAPPAGNADACTGSAVTIKVQNTVADDRLRYTGDPNGGPGTEGDEETGEESPAPTPSAS
ncbi:hypothetical protein [Catellatospora methionotrophica]|uniref:hypothetical protein n=1 Tax=Catellatospora methionotrophica TaxID=121620 RepID=UPI0033CCC274